MKPLNLEQLLSDPRVAHARQTLLQALQERQRTITGIVPPDPKRKIAYDELLQSFGQTRAGNLFFPYLGSGIGNGPLVELADGSVKFDLIGGIGVHHFGHSHPQLVTAALDAALRDTVMQGNLQQNPESAALAADLLNRARPGTRLAHCFLTSSGAMANENALKLIFHQRPGATRVLAFEHTFAGRTLALSSITDKAAYRANMPSVLPVDYLPFFDAEHPAQSTARALDALQGHLARYPGRHAALWCELVLGEGGFYPGATDFFATLFRAARAANLAIVADEVQTFGRTSRLFAFQHFALEEWVDVVTVGKMLQVCATLFTDALRPAPGIISQTFTASTSAILAAQVILRDLLTDDLFGTAGRNARIHERFVRCFTDIAARHPGWLRGPFGTGAMIAFTPFDGTEKSARTLLSSLFDAGIIAFYCGAAPTRLRFLPPVPILTDDHVDAIGRVLEAVLAGFAATAR